MLTGGCVVSKKEIEMLYARFQKLDKSKSGYISAAEFQAIPELSMNPLCHRIIKLFDRDGMDLSLIHI